MSSEGSVAAATPPASCVPSLPAAVSKKFCFFRNVYSRLMSFVLASASLALPLLTAIDCRVSSRDCFRKSYCNAGS